MRLFPFRPDLRRLEQFRLLSLTSHRVLKPVRACAGRSHPALGVKRQEGDRAGMDAAAHGRRVDAPHRRPRTPPVDVRPARIASTMSRLPPMRMISSPTPVPPAAPAVLST